MTRRFIAACVQTNAGPEIDANLRVVGDLARRARDGGATLIATPENVAVLIQGRERVWERARPEGEHPAVAFFAELARETGAWILAGSLAIRLDETRLANRSMLFAADGRVAATYDKVHMFDVDLAGGESYRESATFRPGSDAVIADTPWGSLGMTVCYDVRFPQLFRTLAQAGAEVMAVPSAFTQPTGRAHWHTLLRARAIENGAFVLAPAQVGVHDQGRRTFGHSLIIGPWGAVLADGGEEVGIILAEIDLDEVAEARRAIPSLTHDRPFHLVRATAG